MPRPLLQILLAISVGLASMYFWDPNPAESPDADTSARQSKLPKTYLRKTSSWTYNEQGNLTDVLEADTVDHFPQHNESLISMPRFYSHSGDDRTWSATANNGIYQPRQQKLKLHDEVVLAHDQTGARLDTQAMDINIRRKTAQSKVDVLLSQGENQTRADGMLARLDQETLTLAPNVESIYAPRR